MPKYRCLKMTNPDDYICVRLGNEDLSDNEQWKLHSVVPFGKTKEDENLYLVILEETKR